MKIRKRFLVLLLVAIAVFVAYHFYPTYQARREESVTTETELQTESQSEEAQVTSKDLLFGYSIKGDKVYYKEVEMVGADALTFEIVNDLAYEVAPAIDHNFYYEKGKVVAEVDSGYFKKYNNQYFKRGSEVYGYYDWDMGVYIGPIVGADPDTFVSLTELYSKDKNSVFYLQNKIDGADPATFVILEPPFTKDGVHVYREGKIVIGADASTFSVIKSNYSNMWHNYGKDSLGVYHEAKLLNADPNSFYIKTFKVTLNYNIEFGADADGLYNYGDLLSGIDPNTAILENQGGIIRDSDTRWYRKRTDCYERPEVYIPESEIPVSERSAWVGGGC